MRQCRLPTVKQLSLLEKIIQDYDRIKNIDDLYTLQAECTVDLDDNGYLILKNNKGNIIRNVTMLPQTKIKKYEKYGYVYASY